ncbi:MAG: protease modulator HflK [Sphingomonadales bacterium]|nr:protease modulator HflK [Sphingomonadales bacterium]
MTIFPRTPALRSLAGRFSTNGLFADSKGPWGAGEADEGAPAEDKPKPPAGADGPWGEPVRKRRPDAPFGGGRSLEDFLRKSRQRLGGGGSDGSSSGSGFRPDGALIVWALAAVLALWLVLTSMHSIAPGERGVVTRFGSYAATLSPGVGITLPAPIDRVRKIDVEKIQTIDLGSEESETLMLTGDQNIIDIAYQVRWNIRDPEKYLFELAQPDETIRQVAESTMRAAIANVTLKEAMGDKRGDIENRVQEEMQRVLDGYKSGVLIQGVAIKQADPPAAVNDAFKAVSAAKQQAQSDVAKATSYASQLTARAQGEAAAFDKVYGQYKLAPDVTRRRMYYETMERVLQGVDKTIVEAK